MKTTLIRRASFSLLLLLLVLSHYAQALDGGGPCKSNEDCLHGGSCDHSAAGHVYESECVCTQNYTGPYCETPKVASAKDCVVDSDCQNGGTCNLLDAPEMDFSTKGICDCSPDHYGYHCQERCPCLNGGTCKTLYATGSYECQCPEEFYDRLCATQWDNGGKEERIPITSRDKAEPILISIVAISVWIFFCLLYVARSERGVNNDNDNTGNPGVERTADGRIVYRDGEGDEPELDEVPKDPVIMEDTEPDLTDLELT